jgi:hypothetical protein
MKNRLLTLALCSAFLTACGGGDDERVNAATARTFTYGPAQPVAPPATASATVDGFAAFQSAADESTAVGAQSSLLQVAFEALGDDLGFGGFAAPDASPNALVGEARSRTLATALRSTAATQFDGACTVTQRGADGVVTVAFGDCVFTETTVEGTVTVRVSGTVTGGPGNVTWNMTYTADLGGPDMTVHFGYHDVGRVDVDASSLKAHQEADFGATVASGGQRAELGFAQSVDLDVALDGTCATHITGGTLEAKRVWTKRPAGAEASELADRGVLFSWTGCGVAEARFSR